MGTSIELAVSGVSLDYAKNNMGNDYGFLFQEPDLVRRSCDGINYDYHRDHPEKEAELAECELAFVRSLARVLPRLSLLGHTLEAARLEYERIIAEANSINQMIYADGKQYMSFEEFVEIANLFPLSGLSQIHVDYNVENQAVIAQGRFADYTDSLDRIPDPYNSNMYWSEASFVSSRICILSAPSMLAIFALSTENASAEVTWQFGNIVNAGWVERDAFAAGALRTQAILIATEGASDARILRRALDFLRPEVADFFRFIDGDERHHFWGTGNLVRFAEGLLRIDIQNQVLFLLDNDAEGVEAFCKLKALTMPHNIRSMVLPEIDELRDFPALGPEGLLNCDINRRAAAIECYLDLKLPDYPAARVIWSNYKKDTDTWHGALEHKESYDRHFMKQDIATLTSGSYDTSKLTSVLDAIIAEASRLSIRF